MNFNKILRIVVCLVLVCTLVVGISPIKAKASELVTLSAAAILGITAIDLAYYCGFILAPPDVDFIEDVGEEFQEFVEDVVYTGGLPGSPDDDDDETNNGSDDYTVTEIIQDVTTAGTSVLNEYTTYVGQALKGSMEFYDPRIFGGFAGTLPAFTLFLYWMIQNGYLDRTVDVPVTTGWSYYGDFYLPTFPTIEDHPYQVLVYADWLKAYYMNYSDHPFYYNSSKTQCFCLDSYSHYDLQLSKSSLEDWNVSSSHNSPVHHSRNNSSAVTGSSDVMIWSNFDIYSITDGVTLCFAGSESSSTTKEIERVEPDVVVYNSIAEALRAGGITAAEISIPQKVDLEKIFAGAVAGGLPAVQNQLLQNAQQITTESALKDYQESITYKEDITDVTEPSYPTTEPDTTTPSEGIPIDGTLGGAPVGDFLSNLGDLIMSPFRWFWNQIQSFFDPWLTSIGNWFSNVRADIQALPGKFENWFTNVIDGITSLPQSFSQWFNDLIDGVNAIPDLILDGVESLFFPSEDFLTSKVDDLRENYDFVDSILRTAQALQLGLANITTEPPVIYIDLGATRGDYNIGGKVPFLDLRWYAEYKPTVDILISAFLWICFAWRMLIKLPGIISGMPGDFVAGSAHAMGLSDILPHRSADLERQRVEIRQSIWKGRNK